MIGIKKNNVVVDKYLYYGGKEPQKLHALLKTKVEKKETLSATDLANLFQFKNGHYSKPIINELKKIGILKDIEKINQQTKQKKYEIVSENINIIDGIRSALIPDIKKAEQYFLGTVCAAFLNDAIDDKNTVLILQKSPYASYSGLIGNIIAKNISIHKLLSKITNYTSKNIFVEDIYSSILHQLEPSLNVTGLNINDKQNILDKYKPLNVFEKIPSILSNGEFKTYLSNIISETNFNARGVTGNGDYTIQEKNTTKNGRIDTTGSKYALKVIYSSKTNRIIECHKIDNSTISKDTLGDAKIYPVSNEVATHLLRLSNPDKRNTDMKNSLNSLSKKIYQS